MATTNIQTFSGDVEVAGALTVTGTLTSTTGVDTVALAADATDTSRPIIFSTGTTGSQSLKTDAGITYNPFTNTLSVAGGIDNVVLATDANDASRPIIFSTGTTGSQPLKTDAGITYNPFTNTLSVAGGIDNVVLATDANDASRPIIFSTGTTGSQPLKTDAGITYNPSTNKLSVTGGLSTSISPGDYLTGTAYDGSTARTFDVDATSANTASKVVARDASGNFSAGTITAALTGNADTATTLQTARNINGVSFDGSTEITVTANTPNTLTRGDYLTGSNFNGATATTWEVDATSANTASKVVARDASGNFNAGTITAALSGNASTATKVYVTSRDNTNETHYPTFTSTHVDGNTSLYQDAGFTYNPSSGTLTSTTFSGALSGNASTASQVNVTSRDSVDASHYPTFTTTDADGNTDLYQDAGFYYNPSSGTLTSTTFAGALSGNASTASQVNVTSRDSTDAVHYPTFTTTHANGNTSLYQDLGFTYNPSTGTLTSTTFSGALSGNATTATTAENQSGGTVSATSGTFSGDISFTDSGTTKRGIQGTVATNDFWFVGGGATASNAGFMEIATGDDAGTEPIYARQYSGTPLTGTAVRTLTLLDGSGNSSFPGTVTATNGFTGDVTGNADTATQVYVTSRDSTDASHYPTFTTTDGDGNTSLYQDAGFYYNPSTGTLTSTVFSGTNGIFSGNVGVGTTNPTGKLEIKSGSSSIYATDTASLISNAAINISSFQDSTDYLSIGLLGATYAPLGNNPSAYMQVQWDTNSTPLTSSLLLNPIGGNVGIGITNPSYKLHVEGPINLTSNIVMSGTVFVKAHDASKNFVAIGPSAGQTSQGTSAVAVGYLAGSNNQGASAVAVGLTAGRYNQGASATAVGSGAGRSYQGNSAVAMGVNAGQTSQGASAVAVGLTAGQTSQGIFAVAMGYQAGQTSQGGHATALGIAAGDNSQGSSAVAVGRGAGQSAQGASAVAVGYLAGGTSQGTNAVAVGISAGQTSQGDNSIAIGKRAAQNGQNVAAIAIGGDAGNTSQGVSAIAIGEQAGLTSQGTYAIAIGDQTARYNQGVDAIAVGRDAGLTSQGGAAIAVGRNAGLTSQGASAVAVGYLAGSNNQGASAVAVGRDAGQTSQGSFAVAVGNEAGRYNQSAFATAVGRAAGLTSQGVSATAVGRAAGLTSQGSFAVAVGVNAGQTSQGGSAVAVGNNAGNTSQGDSATAVGRAAGRYNQGNFAVAMGNEAGRYNQGISAVAVGVLAGQTSQGIFAVAIGDQTARYNQGVDAIAVGRIAGRYNQHDNSIALNASGVDLNTNVASAFFVKPLRNTGGTAMYYDTSSGEISYSTSDDRMKVKEVRIKDATTTLMKLSPQSYFKKFTLDEPTISHYESGLMAQDVWYDAPELRHAVHLGAYADPTPEKPSAPTESLEDDPDYSAWGSDPAQVQYDQLIPYTIKSIQEIVAELPRSKTTVSNAWGQNIAGRIVSANANAHKTNATPIVALSNVYADKTWYGVVSNTTTDTNDYDTLVDTKGDTQIWVTDVAGSLESGDLVTTSNVAPGYAQKQGHGALMNYTVAKVTQDCDFTEPTQRPIRVPKRELSNVVYYIQKTEVVVDLYEYEQNLCERRKTKKTETVYRKVHEEGRDTVYFDADGNEVSKRKYETLTGGSVVTYTDVSVDAYNALTPEEQADYTETIKNVYYRVDLVESPVELEDVETEVRQELVDVLDENGQIVWEETGETEPVYTLVDHGSYKAALVSAKLV